MAPGSREVEFQPQTALGQADAAREPGGGGGRKWPGCLLCFPADPSPGGASFLTVFTHHSLSKKAWPGHLRTDVPKQV